MVTLLNNLSSAENYFSAFDDPRLISGSHGDKILLDGPVRDGCIPDSKMYCQFNQSASNPRGYSDLNLGDIQYYYDCEINNQPFQRINWPFVNISVKEDYYDPMGTYRPRYHLNQGNSIQSMLKDLDDSFQHRQDIMAKQNYKFTENKPLLKYCC